MSARNFFVLTLLSLVGLIGAQQTVYEYFTEGGINSGLVANDPEFFELNGKQFKIFSGSMHYFRIHPDYWRDRLRKYRAAGLNAIDVYVPWNLHEPERGVFDFGQGGRDFSHFLDLPAFLSLAQEEDLLVIFRPGPYICAEWEYGGLPSWLLSEYPMYPRLSFTPYEDRVAIYLNEVISRVEHLQFYTETGIKGGPIIMTQIENEYGHYGYSDYPRDKVHLRYIKNLFEDAGFGGLLFTSDSPAATLDWGNVDNVLMTANFKRNSIENLDAIRELQPDKPILVSEYWPGWFDHWFEQVHNTLNTDDFAEILTNIFNYKGSVNFYMFHGGTNFGFMNGGNWLDTGSSEFFPRYVPDVTSYDYDAPLTESGDYTEKYYRAVEMIADYDPLASVLSKPNAPGIIPPVAYPTIGITEYLNYDDIIANVPAGSIQSSENLLSMEQLDLNNGNGQSYGYIVYRKQISLTQGSILKIRGHIRDLLQVMVNGVQINKAILEVADLVFFGSWAVLDDELTIDLSNVPGGCSPDCTLDLFVENLGRANFGLPHEFSSRKGLYEGPVLIDGVEIKDWEIIPLEFKGDWVQGLTGWRPFDASIFSNGYAPKVLKASLTIDGTPSDTYFDFDCAVSCTEWKHGAVFVNGFNIGRYYQVGPQKTLYIPGPALQTGTNEIILMENYLGTSTISFTDTPYYGVPFSPESDEEYNDQLREMDPRRHERKQEL